MVKTTTKAIAKMVAKVAQMAFIITLAIFNWHWAWVAFSIDLHYSWRHDKYLSIIAKCISYVTNRNHLLLMPADWCRTHWCRSHWCRSLFMPMKHFWCQSRLMPVTFEAEEALLMPVTIDARHFWCQSLLMPVAVDALCHYWCQSLLMSILSNRNIAHLT